MYLYKLAVLIVVTSLVCQINAKVLFHQLNMDIIVNSFSLSLCRCLRAATAVYRYPPGNSPWRKRLMNSDNMATNRLVWVDLEVGTL